MLLCIIQHYTSLISKVNCTTILANITSNMKYIIGLIHVAVIFGMTSCRPAVPSQVAIIRDMKVNLPGSERINKRSAEDYFETISDLPTDDSDYSEDSYYTLYELSHQVPEEESIPYDSTFKPKRLRRSVENLPKSRNVVNVIGDDNQDLDAAANIIFRPLFRRRVRSLPELNSHENEELHIGEFTQDDLDLAENIIFRPVFRRGVRSVSANSDINQMKNEDDLVVAENIIFRPVFRRGLNHLRSP